MARTFIFTASSSAGRSHYQRSVVDGVPLAELTPHVRDQAILKTLVDAFPEGRAFCWGGKAGGQDERYWRRMEPGDLVLGYRAKSIVCGAFIVATIQDRAAAIAAWPDTRASPYDLVYFFSTPIFIDPPRLVADLPEFFGSMYQGLREIRGSSLVEERFGSVRAFLRDVLARSMSNDARSASVDVEPSSTDGPAGGREGAWILVRHLKIERDRALVMRAKRYWLRADRQLRCRCCGFSFEAMYGMRGVEFIEAHHMTPLAELASADSFVTEVSDLAPVCANCHRMLHRNGGCSVDVLRTELDDRQRGVTGAG